jgi:2,4-dienoyl-CoA reductase-like NADH-dependent reductase (Old Yellow Enzyme family)
VSDLFTPLRLRGTAFRNRVFVAPMCQYMAQDGVANNWHLVNAGSRAVGGAGLVLLEATAVVPEGRISAADLGLWSDAQAEALGAVARFVAAQGAVPGIQLAHAGRKASTAVPWSSGAPVAPDPRPLGDGELAALVEAFAGSARRASAAGFEVVEIHAAHGYLLHQFLSPLANHRVDDHGGSLENRMRFPLAVVRAVRDAWPAGKPLFVRLSATDWADGGWDLEQSISFAHELCAIGVDLIDCSSGGMVPGAKVPVSPGYQVPFAAAIRRETRVATGAVGLITDPVQADSIIAAGEADAVLLARAVLRDPYWALHAAQRLGDDVDYWPKPYLRAL